MTWMWFLLQPPSQQHTAESSNTVLIIIGIVTAVCTGGGLTATITWLANRGKSSAEEAEIWTKASVTRLKSMHEEMGTLETRVRSLNEALEMERQARLTAQRSEDAERQARLQTVRQLEAAIALLERHGIDYKGIVSPREAT